MDRDVHDDEREQQLLGQYWNDLAGGKDEAPPTGLDPRLAETVRWLRGGAEPGSLDGHFDDELRGLLMTSAGISSIASNGTASYVPTAAWSVDGVRPRLPKRRAGHWALTQLATAALLVLTLGSIFIAFGGTRLHTLVGPSGDVGEVRMYRGSAARTGIEPGPGPIGMPTVRWQVETDWTVFNGAVAAVDGMLYVGTTGGALVAHDATTGQERWRAPAGGYNGSPPAIVDGVVYTGSNDHFVYAFDAETGEERWRFDTGHVLGSGPAVVDGVVYIGAGDYETTGAVFALDAASGRQIWRFDADGAVNTAPAVVDGVVYAGSGSFGHHGHTLYAIDAATGQERWHFDTGAGGAIPDAPAVAGGIVYAGTVNGLFAVDAATGKELWRFVPTFLKSIMTAPAVSDGIVYVVSSSQLTALDAKTGTERWHAEAAGSTITISPTVADGVVYVADSMNDLVALDAATGKERWRFVPEDGSFFSSPAIVDGVIYIGTGSFGAGRGVLYALADPDPTASPASDSITTKTLVETTVDGLPEGYAQIFVERWHFGPGPAVLVQDPVLDGPYVVTVESGSLAATVAGKEQTLTPGEPLVIASGQPFDLRNAGTVDASAVMVGFATTSHVGGTGVPESILWEDGIATSSTTLPTGPLNVVVEELTVPPGAALPPFVVTDQEWIGVYAGRPSLTIEGERLPPGWRSGQEREVLSGQGLPVIRPGWRVTIRNGDNVPLILFRLSVTPSDDMQKV